MEEQTHKGTAEATDILRSVVSGLCLSEIDPSEGSLLELQLEHLELQLLPAAPVASSPAVSGALQPSSLCKVISLIRSLTGCLGTKILGVKSCFHFIPDDFR